MMAVRKWGETHKILILKSVMWTSAFVLAFILLPTIGPLTSAIVNALQSTSIVFILGYVAYRSGPVVRSAVAPVITFAFMYSIIFWLRVNRGGVRAEGWVGEIGPTLANFIWYPVWFRTSWLLAKAAKREKRILAETVEADKRAIALLEGPDV